MYNNYSRTETWCSFLTLLHSGLLKLLCLLLPGSCWETSLYRKMLPLSISVEGWSHLINSCHSVIILTNRLCTHFWQLHLQLCTNSHTRVAQILPSDDKTFPDMTANKLVIIMIDQFGQNYDWLWNSSSDKISPESIFKSLSCKAALLMCKWYEPINVRYVLLLIMHMLMPLQCIARLTVSCWTYCTLRIDSSSLRVLNYCW